MTRAIGGGEVQEAMLEVLGQYAHLQRLHLLLSVAIPGTQE
ncbi:hypothetical protein [Enterococcus rivorum]|nr:hypothetical protein [Enterococcus rivorum]